MHVVHDCYLHCNYGRFCNDTYRSEALLSQLVFAIRCVVVTVTSHGNCSEGSESVFIEHPANKTYTQLIRFDLSGTGLGGSPFPGLGLSGLGIFPELQQMHPETLIVMRDLTNLMSNADVLLDKVRNNPQIRENLHTIMRTADQVLRGFDENNQEANSNPFTAVLGGGDLGGVAQNQAANLATAGGDLGGAETTTGSPAPSTDPLPNPGAAAGGQVSSVEQCGSGLGGSTFPELSLINLVEFPELEQMHPETLNLMRVYVNLLNNLEVMFDQVMEDPETREFLDRNPEIGYKLNDPATKRRMEALRNHALKTENLREMMRFADRVLSLIDAFAAGGGDLGGAETITGSPALNTDPLPNPCAAAGELKRLNPKDLKMIRELVLDIGNEHDLAVLGRKMEDLKMAALSNPERLRRIMRNIDLVIVGIEEKVMKAKSNMFAAVLGGGDLGGVAQNQAANRANTGGRVE